MAEHVEQRKAGAQVLMHHVGTPDLMRAAFAQAEQAGGVIDLAVEQDDGLYPGVTQGTARLHGRKALQLRTDVRRGVAQHPVHPVVGQGNGRLRARMGTQAAIAKATAIGAVAVPLGKAAAGGGAENLDMHGELAASSLEMKTPRSLAGRGVALQLKLSGWRSTW